MKSLTRYLIVGIIVGLNCLGFQNNSEAGTISAYTSVPGVQTDTHAAHPKPQFIFINKKDAATTGVNFKCTATPDNGSVSAYSWIFTGGTPSTSTSQNPGTVKFAGLVEGDSKLCTVGVTHPNSSGPNCSTSSDPKLNINVVVPKIEPDAGQAGTNGDIVPSVVTTGDQELHYVSPKATNSDYVILTVNAPGVTSTNFGILLEWDTAVGEDVPGSPNKWRIKRGTSGKFTVKLKRVNDHAEVARMNVWIVWADITSTSNAITPTSLTMTTGDGTSGPGLKIAGGYNFSHEIKPASIITDTDRPNLSGGNATNPPGGNHWTGDPLSGGADMKWDNTRQIRSKVINPSGFANGSLANPTSFWTSQPISYPSNDVEGNDDRSTLDETNDPYANSGKLTGSDAPSMLMKHSVGANGDTFEVRLHFQEFTRLEINGQWYRISNFYPWRIHLRMKKAAGVWGDDTTVKDLTNGGF